MTEMKFKVVASSLAFQCLFFKIFLHLDEDVPENQKFMGEQKLMFHKNFMN